MPFSTGCLLIEKETATLPSVTPIAATRYIRQATFTLLVFVAALLVWELTVKFFAIHPLVLPAPTRVLSVAWQDRVALAKGFAVTGTAALTALSVSILSGSLIAILFSQSSLVRVAFQPYVIFLQTVPIVAIAPLLITWFGYGFGTVVLVAAIISLFPIISNVTAGLLSVDRNLLEFFRLQRAGRMQTLVKLQIPNAVSHLVLGTRISAGLTVIGAIIGELFVGSGAKFAGLGTMMTGRQNLGKTDALMAVILTSTLLGVVMLTTVNLLSWLVLRRWTASSGFEGNAK